MDADVRHLHNGQQLYPGLHEAAGGRPLHPGLHKAAGGRQGEQALMHSPEMQHGEKRHPLGSGEQATPAGAAMTSGNDGGCVRKTPALFYGQVGSEVASLPMWSFGEAPKLAACAGLKEL
ncbi:hypothetical protein NDU88_004910 [Pleurodeles waltl]|uniref:Uncharacterized protein n=1 Tax=Pleurodeles waltl TaxID=8319 RepID=A0AAV7VHL2_PLEWA|nr:hypothetical protein NDU88_004910 [Pleurodeles waltl]